MGGSWGQEWGGQGVQSSVNWAWAAGHTVWGEVSSERWAVDGWLIRGNGGVGGVEIRKPQVLTVKTVA